MRIRWVGGVALALVAGLVGSWARAAEDDDSAPSKPAWDHRYTWGGKGDERKPKEEEKKKAVVPESPPPPRPSPADQAAAGREREERAFFRRMAVLDRLAEIAERTTNADMKRQVEELQERNWAVYQQRTGSPAARKAMKEMGEEGRGLAGSKTTPSRSREGDGGSTTAWEVNP